MILQALVDYYETMAARGDIPRSGWGTIKVSHALQIDAEGGLIAVLPLSTPDEKGKKLLPRPMELPTPVKRAVGILPNFLWDNAGYLLGFDGKGKPERAEQCFAAARELHLTLLDGQDDPYARAVCAFFRSWDPATARTHPAVAPCAAELEAGGNITFLFGDAFPGQCPALAAAWQAHYDAAGDDSKMRCLVTGQRTMPERIHPAVKGVRGAQPVGGALVAFNATAFCSYGREQSLNAPVGKYAAFAYTTALNHLIADRAHVKIIGDTTVVFWAEDGAKQYQDAVSVFLDPPDDTVSTADVKAVLDRLADGDTVDWDGLPLEPDNRFYILGIAPNAARLSVRFFLRDTFGAMAANLKAHYDRLAVARPAFDKWDTLPLWVLLRETVNPNARDKAASPQMAGDTLRAVLTGGRYPATLYQGVQLRICADRQINRARAAIIKAYLLRNTTNEIDKEALTVELNEATTYQPYVLGRLFSVLEDIQAKASPGVNTTIKDKYLSSACANPAMVFPILLDLSEKHMRKLEIGQRIYCSKQLLDLTARLTEAYPVQHNLHDRGVFQLGYYHQTQKRFEKKNKEELNHV